MRAVAQGAGVTAAAIYRHFRDKTALVEHVVTLAFENLDRSLLEAIAPHEVGTFARIAALGEAYLRFAAEHEEEFKVLTSSQLRTRPSTSSRSWRIGCSWPRRTRFERPSCFRSRG